MTHDDRDLRQVFDALKGAVAGMPSMADLTSSSALSQWRRRRVANRAAVIATAIAISLLWQVKSREPAMPDFERFSALTGLDPGEVTWRAPSDVLLDVPGNDLLRALPVIEIPLSVISPDTAQIPDSNDSKRRSGP
jgi:hypothetical protein